MKIKVTFTLPNLNKVETLTEEQKKQMVTKQHHAILISSLKKYYTNLEPKDAVAEININYDGTIDTKIIFAEE